MMDSIGRPFHGTPNFMNNILDEIFHPTEPICKIIPTATKKAVDYFNVFRPPPKTCLDYTISQTDAKIDARDTRIHIQQTVAEYIPDLNVTQVELEYTERVGAAFSTSEPAGGASFPKKNKYFSGGAPQWEFLEEIFQRQQEELQKQYHIEFKKRVAKRKKMERHQMDSEHRKVIRFVGPAWYQELSPNQLATINKLKSCILKDLSEDTITNTQENIGQLGIVLRPHHTHIEKALKNCCKCPVEFLLILYQLMNPSRSEYSINDRLLLSAVVHLTMTDTLKELHVRIPSPPAPCNKRKKLPKKRKRACHESPYLEPFNFKRKRARFSGVYVNKHVQHPRSPYFSYLKEFKKMQGQGNENKNKAAKLRPIEAEIEQELMLAQTMYEELVEFRPVPKLLKPSRFITCQNFRNNTTESLISDQTIPEKEKDTEQNIDEKEEKENVKIVQENVIKDGDKIVEEEEIKEEEVENAEEVTEGEGDMQQEEEEEEETNLPVSARGGGPVYYSTADVKTKNSKVAVSLCDCSPKSTQTECYYEDNKEIDLYQSNAEKIKENTYVHSHEGKQSHQQGVFQEDFRGRNVRQESGHVENKVGGCRRSFSTVGLRKNPHSCTNVLQNSNLKTCKHADDVAIYDKMYPLIRPNAARKPCKCKENYKQFIEKVLCPCSRCEEERKNKNINYVIGGLKETESCVTTRIIDSVVERKRCDCLKKYESKIEAYEKEKDEEAQSPCGCRKLAKELLEKPLCHCEKCQEDRKKKTPKYIIVSGIKETENENLRIVEGISVGKPCQCIRHYEKKVGAYEDFQKSKNAVSKLKEQEHKFVIGGVVKTPQGPAYIISGMRPQIDCICAKEARKEEARQHMQAMMPHIPPGRIKYGISGVKETADGNVYLLNDALPIDDCDCMTLYETFGKQHSTCLQTYERYLVKMKEEYNEFMNEMLPSSSERRESRASRVSGNLKTYESSDKVQTTINTEDVETVSRAIDNGVGEFVPSDKRSRPPTIIEPCGTCNCINPCFARSSSENVRTPTVECIQCDEEPVDCVDCICGGEIEIERMEDEPPQPTLRRFFIFPKILCDHKWQMKILQSALTSMAEDDYPLAKLPESYKLPHLKLWMQMRCKKSWTKKDGFRYICKSKDMWRHTRVCRNWSLLFPKLSISKSEAPMLDWSTAAYCKKLVNDALEKFYREMKQNIINFGREYFPTTFSNEFHFKTWRDCYFAYTPSKEEDVQARYVWQKYDFTNYADLKRICE